MTEKTTFIFIDRRHTGSGKSLSNRQKLLKRVKDSIRNAKPEDIDADGIGKVDQASSGNTHTNPVKVARIALSTPTFRYDMNAGEREIVLVGNDHFLKGDEFPISRSEGGAGGTGVGSGPGEEGEDDFIINISRTEFFDVFFEGCELPDLKETHEKDLPEHVMQRAGFQKSGNPGQLSVIRSFKLSKARRLALTRDDRDRLEKLEAEQADLLGQLAAEVRDPLLMPVRQIKLRLKVIEQELEALQSKIARVSMYEDLDLRFRKTERVKVKASDAVLIMIMDISGSMDEEKKRMARKFFSLQYAFIKRLYPQTDLIFIAHTDTPEEMTEEDFFTTRKSGGTIVSPAWALAHRLIRERYDPEQTNVYISYAGDGDNWPSDGPSVVQEIEASTLLTKTRHVVYVQVGQSFAASFGGGPTLWSVMSDISQRHKKLACLKLNEEQEVFDAFKTLYKRRVKK